MSTLKDLKKRLNGVQATRQLAFAMKTASSIKFSRINNALGGWGRYMDCSEEIASLAGTGAKAPANQSSNRLFVLVSGNRGLCGGYNIELFSLFDEIVKANPENALYITCGKKAAEHCRAKNIPVIKEIAISDIPSYEEAAALEEELFSLYESGKVREINFVYQRHINLLKREPVTKRFLPSEEHAAQNADDIIFVPDKQTVADKIYSSYLNNTVYTLLLNCAAGVQAATLTAMRSAYDTASESEVALQTAIQRRRQADVTAGVLETAAENTDY